MLRALTSFNTNSFKRKFPSNCIMLNDGLFSALVAAAVYISISAPKFQGWNFIFNVRLWRRTLYHVSKYKSHRFQMSFFCCWKRTSSFQDLSLRGFSALGCQKSLSDQSQNLAMSFGYVFLHEKLGYKSASGTQISPVYSPEFLLIVE